MKTINYHGTEYKLPFSETFRRHTKDERLTIANSIAKHGVQNPVLVYEDTEYGDHCILDGEGRLTVCASNPSITVPLSHLGRMTTAKAYELATVYNDHRRQDTPEAIKARKLERIERVSEARTEGKSIREIAEDEGVSKAQVERDVDQLSRGGQLKNPSKVKGRDGKTRVFAPKPPKPDAKEPPAPKIAQPQIDETLPEVPGVYTPRLTKTSTAKVVIDAYDNPVPSGVADSFMDGRLRAILMQVRSAAEDFHDAYEQLAKLKAKGDSALHYPWLELHTVKAEVEKARNAAVLATDIMKLAMPHGVCPDCSGKTTGCKSCRMSGYWPRQQCEDNAKRFRKGSAPLASEAA